MITLRNSLLWTYIFAIVLPDWLFTQPEHRIEKLGSITLFCFELSPFNWKQHRRSRRKFCDRQIKLPYSIFRIVDHTRDIVRPGFFGWTRNDCTQKPQCPVFDKAMEVKFVLKDKLDLNCLIEYGHTALVTAAFVGSIKCCKVFIHPWLCRVISGFTIIHALTSHKSGYVPSFLIGLLDPSYPR